MGCCRGSKKKNKSIVKTLKAVVVACGWKIRKQSGSSVPAAAIQQLRGVHLILLDGNGPSRPSADAVATATHIYKYRRK